MTTEAGAIIASIVSTVTAGISTAQVQTISRKPWAMRPGLARSGKSLAGSRVPGRATSGCSSRNGCSVSPPSNWSCRSGECSPDALGELSSWLPADDKSQQYPPPNSVSVQRLHRVHPGSEVNQVQSAENPDYRCLRNSIAYSFRLPGAYPAALESDSRRQAVKLNTYVYRACHV